MLTPCARFRRRWRRMSIKIDQAFTSDFMAQSFGLPIAHENAEYDPSPGVAFVEIKCFPNEESALDLDSTNQTTGFFQFILRYPEGSGAITAKAMRQTIFDAYPIGRVLTYSGQTVDIAERYPFDAVPEDGWFRVSGRINYTARIERT